MFQSKENEWNEWNKMTTSELCDVTMFEALTLCIGADSLTNSNTNANLSPLSWHALACQLQRITLQDAAAAKSR